MTTKTELDTLLAAYERANSKGAVKDANKLLPIIIRAVVEYVEKPGVPTEDEEIIARLQASPARHVFYVDTGSASANKVIADLVDKAEGIKEGVEALLAKADEAVEKVVDKVVEEAKEALKGETCEPCTPTEEKPNGVAETPFTVTGDVESVLVEEEKVVEAPEAETPATKPKAPKPTKTSE